MPRPHVSSLTPFVLRLAAGLTAGSLGIRRRARPPRPRTPRLSDSGLRAHWTGMRAPGPTKLLRSAVLGTFALVLLAGAGVYAGYEIKSSREMKARAVALTAGDPDLGRRLAQRYGCASCHTIPGVPGAGLCRGRRGQYARQADPVARGPALARPEDRHAVHRHVARGGEARGRLPVYPALILRAHDESLQDLTRQRSASSRALGARPRWRR